mmetsp:Transcript_79442/g.228006  ORF Transcript_79442/g.228006 Transcript_79442/m.228006 type:complete len:354 (-) Transcript_79442:544-1605(-)
MQAPMSAHRHRRLIVERLVQPWHLGVCNTLEVEIEGPPFHAAGFLHVPPRLPLHVDAPQQLHASAFQEDHVCDRPPVSRWSAQQVYTLQGSDSDQTTGIVCVHHQRTLDHLLASFSVHEPRNLVLRAEEKSVAHSHTLVHNQHGAVLVANPCLRIVCARAAGPQRQATGHRSPVEPRAPFNNNLHHALTLLCCGWLHVECPTRRRVQTQECGAVAELSLDDLHELTLKEFGGKLLGLVVSWGASQVHTTRVQHNVVPRAALRHLGWGTNNALRLLDLLCHLWPHLGVSAGYVLRDFGFTSIRGVNRTGLPAGKDLVTLQRVGNPTTPISQLQERALDVQWPDPLADRDQLAVA